MSPARTSNPAPPERWLTIVGIGEDGLPGLGAAARGAIAGAVHVFGGARHLALAKDQISGAAHPWPSPFDPAMSAIISRRGEKVCVLASGDPFWHGVGATLARLINPGEMQVFPAPSAFSLAAARLGWPLQDVICLSLHAAPVDLLKRHLQPGRCLITLTSGAQAPALICRTLQEAGFGASKLTLLQALGGPHERITEASPDALEKMSEINPLNVLAIEPIAGSAGPAVRPLCAGLPDDCFEHDGQITKRDIRALTISALQPKAGQCLWDIGAGSGSIAIEWMLSHSSMRAIAIEADETRAERIVENARSFGVPGLQVVRGSAPLSLQDLPAPDAIFIGGGGTVPGVIETALAALDPGGRLVANSVTLEMQTLLIELHKRLGGRLVKIDIAQAAPLGSMTTWRPALPITQWSWSKP